MNKNKAVSAKDGSNTDLIEQLTMNENTPNRNKFQYHCSFCACELPDDGARFNGVGACPACDDLARLWVNSLRVHAAHYFNNLGVRK